jgi:hypothetical protein
MAGYKTDLISEATIQHQAMEIAKLNSLLNRVKYVGYLWRPVGAPLWTFAEEDKPKSVKPEYEVLEVYSWNDANYNARAMD